LSIFVVCLVTTFGIILAHALLSLGISLPFFDYQATPFKIADMWYFLESLLFEFLVYLFVAALISWLCVNMKNIGMVIVMYIAIVFGFTMIAGVLQVVLVVLATQKDMQNTVKILQFIQDINVFNSSATIGTSMSYTAKQVWYYVLPPVIGTGAILGHGILSFKKKDLK
jgi:hypothetical protein